VFEGGKSGIFMHVYSQTFRPNDLGIHLFLIVRSKSLKRANLSEGNNKPSAFEMCQKTNRRWSLSATLLAMGSKEMGTRGWDVSLFPFYFIIWIFKSKYLANHLSKLWTVFTWISRSEIFKLDPILICFDKLFTEFPKLLRLYLSSSATCIQVFIELYLCFYCTLPEYGCFQNYLGCTQILVQHILGFHWLLLRASLIV
jgi:hypothetical protein